MSHRRALTNAVLASAIALALVFGPAMPAFAAASPADIVEVDVGGGHWVALRANGSCVARGDNTYGQTMVSGPIGFSAIKAGGNHSVLLRWDGTCYAVGENSFGQTNVDGWTDIVAIDARNFQTVGLRSDGTCVGAGRNNDGRLDVGAWVDIVSIAAGLQHTVAVKSDGTCVATGDNTDGRLNVSAWTGIVAAAAGNYHTVGLKSNGTCVATGLNTDGQCDVTGWTDIVAIAAGPSHSVGLKRDGTCVAVGANASGQTNVAGWTDIAAIGAGDGIATVGVKRDGTCVSTPATDLSAWGIAGTVNASAVGVAGPSRIDTAVEASKEAFPAGADTVVIATAFNWPDALGGAALAGAVDGPILLTSPVSLPTVVSAEIARLGATDAIILGGTGAVGPGVQSALVTQLGAANVERLAGASRYETARMVAARTVEQLEGTTGYLGTAFVATGANFPDALGASPLAAARNWPIYLVNPALGIDGTLAAAMSADGVKRAIVLGGTSAVSAGAEADLQLKVGCSTMRLAGANRYATAAAVASFGVRRAGLGWNHAAIATGQNFPDALAGGVLQGVSGSVMLLTPTSTLDGGAAAILTANKARISEVRFLGGPDAVGAAVRTAATAAVR